MSISFDFPKMDDFYDAQHFSASDECSHQKELGPHYHIEIEREMSGKGVGYADVAVSLTVEQARELHADIEAFLKEVTQ